MSQADLTALARGGGSSPATSATATHVPKPKLRWKTRILLPGVVLLATASLLAVAASDALWPRTSVRVVPVVVKTDVEAQPEGTVVVQAPGWVEADPFPTGVSALTDGVVEEVLVLEGERVEQGQIVARLVDEDAAIALEQAEAVLAEREAALAAAQAALEEAQRNWDHPIELTRKLETAKAQLAEKQAELERWPAELEREQAHAVYLAAEHKRIEPLHAAGQASDIELIQARQAHASQQAEVEAVQRRKPILEAQIAALKAEVQAARENLELRIADTRALADAEAAMRRAEAAVAAARARRNDAALQFERTAVRSPVSGVVMTRLAEPGSKLLLRMDNPHSAQVVRLYDPRALQVRVDIPLVDAAKVGVGQPAEVIVDVLPERTFDGHITRVVHEADVQKNTLQVKVAIENPSPELKPEMLARARFLALPDTDTDGTEAVTAQQLFVPESAIGQRDGQNFVWVADQTARQARRVEVTPSRTVQDGWVAVTGGLRPGDRVIVNPPADLRDGNRIRMQEE